MASLKDHILSLILGLPFLKTFLKKESPFPHISNALSLLEKQEEDEDLDDPLKDHILSVKFGLRFLETILNFSSNENLKKRIEHVIYNVRQELYSLADRRTDGSLILDLDLAYTNLREKMKNVVIKPETREYDVMFPKLFCWSLRKTNDFLLLCFSYLSSCKADLISPLTKELEDLQEKLILLQALLTYVADTGVHVTEENKKLLTPLSTLLDKAACLLYSCLVDKMDEGMALSMKSKLSDLLETINVKEIYIVVLGASKLLESADNPLRSEFYLLDNLIKLLDINTSFVIYRSDPRKKLRNKLKILKTFLEDLYEPRVEKLCNLVTSIEAITWKAIPILYTSYDEDLQENMAGEVSGALSEVLDQIENILVEAREMKLYNYPKVDELGFLDLFLGHLEELLKYQQELIGILRSQIETLHMEFDSLRYFLRIINEDHNENKELGDLWTHIIHLAYQAEHVIDFYLVKYPSDSRIMSSLSEIIVQIKLIKSKMESMYVEEKNHRSNQAQNVGKTSIHVSSHVTTTGSDEVEGFEDEAERVMEYLVADIEQLDVVSIVGMPGLGKTTLAKKMYEAPLIVERFDVRAWCSISQTYHKRELLLTILGDIVIRTDKINELNDEELAAKLFKSLKGRRYLIVIDDIWDIKAWDGLKRSLPNDKNHSRILITTRLQNVASQTKNGSKVHHLRPFSDDESWKLFQKKLYQEGSFSEEFLEVGKRIAQSCKGLPLAIVVIAGLLPKVEKSVHKWKQIAINLSSHILSDSERQCKAILELSYNHLPDHLKSCFLYFGAFAEDEKIPVWKLKWLWIAEGFVRNSEAKSLEDVVEEYFMDLLSRSLITTTEERSLGGVKTCCVHDLLRDFCLEKAKEESFLQMTHVHDWSELSRVYNQRRLSIYSKVFDLIMAEPYGCMVRSLLHTATRLEHVGCDVSFISQNFKLVKVLDLSWARIKVSLKGIELLIHLRYLAVEARKIFIPSSIANLWNLQFFLVINRSSRVVDVPDSLWDMVNLRHVHINRYAFFNVHRRRLENSSLLDNLETLSTPCFSCKEDAENLLRRLPKLRKLGCVFRGSTNCHEFPVMDFLSQLTSLKMTFEGLLDWGTRYEFHFPPNLQKLTLSGFQFLSDNISKLGRTLPNLKVLKLISNHWGMSRTMNGETWYVDDGDFPKLKYLKLSHIYDICEWIASEDSFPNLEQLVLENCSYLEEIPPYFGEIPTLQMITVAGCKSCVDDSARRIQKEQHEELQNEEFKVHIYPRGY